VKSVRELQWLLETNSQHTDLAICYTWFVSLVFLLSRKDKAWQGRGAGVQTFDEIYCSKMPQKIGNIVIWNPVDLRVLVMYVCMEQDCLCSLSL
jgi:hypothetical protein